MVRDRGLSRRLLRLASSPGLSLWVVFPNSEALARLGGSPSLSADPQLRLISERSPYMRTER